jgi:hypothetical protein
MVPGKSKGLALPHTSEERELDQIGPGKVAAPTPDNLPLLHQITENRD